MRKYKVFSVMMLMVFLVGCASLNIGGMTPKQQYAIAANTYNAQYDDTMNVMKSATSTPAQKQVAQQKKMILTQMWPILILVGNTLNAGGTPTASDLTTLNNFVNQLTTIVSSPN
jgi:hypothetical protein